MSRGCHDLIKQGVCLVDDIDDIIDELQQLIPHDTQKRVDKLDSRPEVQLTETEQVIVKALWQGERDVDGLARELVVSVQQMSAHILVLEMKRVVRMLPGRKVALVDALRERV